MYSLVLPSILFFRNRGPYFCGLNLPFKRLYFPWHLNAVFFSGFPQFCSPSRCRSVRSSPFYADVLSPLFLRGLTPEMDWLTFPR